MDIPKESRLKGILNRAKETTLKSLNQNLKLNLHSQPRISKVDSSKTRLKSVNLRANWTLGTCQTSI